jgi:CDP-diacylglycerol--serine O-phosphatidyltransferase
MKKKKFIGYYRDCDLLTMTGTCMALLGCIFAINGSKLLPIFFLILSGICDGFDGKLARRKKHSDEQNVYGVQLDSLSDLISFGVFPLVLTVSCLPKNAYLAWLAIVFYSICGMIRLAYFNTLNICKKDEKGYFIGAPITSISIIYPVLYLICLFKHFMYFEIIVTIFFTLVGLSFIYRIKIKKLDEKGKVLLSLAGLILIILVLLKMFFHFR